MFNACILALASAGEGSQINRITGKFRAHTEHRGMGIGSVETAVERGDPSCEQLHLHSVELTGGRLR